MTEAERSILDLARRNAPAEAVEALLELKPRALVEATRTAVVHLVTVEKDPASAILLGWAGATRTQTLAREAPALHGLGSEFSEHARSLFFTLGSLLWPGWGAADLTLDATARAIGRACAERARALAAELGSPALLRSRSHWLVGVHATFAGESETGRREIVDAARWAERANADAEVKLLRAYLLMAQAVGLPNDPEIAYEFDRVCRGFEADDATAPFGQQLRVAWSALAPERPLPQPARTQG